MIIVAGTRRSGTSLWMQILQQGGFQLFGKQFPAHWQQIATANKKGFYESKLVEGINYQSNPDPVSGAWFSPQESANYAVKVLENGLIKSDLAYIDKVIVTVRNWQDCESSKLRLKQIIAQEENFIKQDNNINRPVKLPAGYEWWSTYAGLVHDMMSRQYPAAVFSYEAVLADPTKVISTVFNWLGSGDVNKASAAVEESLQTQKNVALHEISHDHSEVFDELYQALHQNIQITQPFYNKLAETNKKIQLEISELNSAS